MMPATDEGEALAHLEQDVLDPRTDLNPPASRCSLTRRYIASRGKTAPTSGNVRLPEVRSTCVHPDGVRSREVMATCRWSIVT